MRSLRRSAIQDFGGFSEDSFQKVDSDLKEWMDGMSFFLGESKSLFEKHHQVEARKEVDKILRELEDLRGFCKKIYRKRVMSLLGKLKEISEIENAPKPRASKEAPKTKEASVHKQEPKINDKEARHRPEQKGR